MKTIVYSQRNCPGCDTLKAKLKAEGVDFTEIVIGVDIGIDEFKEKFPTVRSVPHTVSVKDEVW